MQKKELCYVVTKSGKPQDLARVEADDDGERSTRLGAKLAMPFLSNSMIPLVNTVNENQEMRDKVLLGLSVDD